FRRNGPTHCKLVPPRIPIERRINYYLDVTRMIHYKPCSSHNNDVGDQEAKCINISCARHKVEKQVQI
ncbi:5697_t:CDS:1, partial [Funneliformis caledonium]